MQNHSTLDRNNSGIVMGSISGIRQTRIQALHWVQDPFLTQAWPLDLWCLTGDRRVRRLQHWNKCVPWGNAWENNTRHSDCLSIASSPRLMWITGYIFIILRLIQQVQYENLCFWLFEIKQFIVLLNFQNLKLTPQIQNCKSALKVWGQ